MLRELRIQNFAIIDDLTLTFRHGLNVITGETGAGKSIILQALSLLAGSRVQADVVRTDAEEASIEALFDCVLPAEVRESLGIDSADEILVQRQIARSGKGRIRMNGGPTTVAVLGRLGEHLVRIYGQHDQTQLLHPASQMDFLDRFGSLNALAERMRDAYEALVAERKRLGELTARRAVDQQRRDLLAFQVGELRAARLRPGEEAELGGERVLIRSAERIHRVCHDGENALYAGETAAVAELARLEARLSELVEVAPDLAGPRELVETARVQLEEAAMGLRAQAERMQFEPGRLEAVEERLAVLTELGRKYRAPCAELPAVLQQLEADLSRIDCTEPDHQAAVVAVAAREAEASQIAIELSGRRDDAATELQKRLATELGVLGMPQSVFRVVRQESAAPRLAARGIDQLEFHLSANPGEAPRPLARIVSGGELSRIMLALEALTAATTDTSLLVFDEVDSGIGGAVADAVGRRLKKIATGRQLLCITHLPQIAAYADHHYAVAKHSRRGRTTSEARLLKGSERVHELSRMLGGGVAPAEALRYARRLVEQGQRGGDDT